MSVALVTGASRGLGAAIAEMLAASGYRVGLNYLKNTAAAENVVSRIQKAGGKAQAFQFDVTEERAVKQGLDGVVKAMGPIDCVVNNAIGFHDFVPIESQTWDDHWDQIRFCIKAPVLIMSHLVGPWKERGAGKIINIGSEVHDIGNAGFAHYVSAKSAMVGLTRSWARELGPHGINVNLVAPGFIPVERHEGVKDQMIADYRPHLPFHRMGTVADIGNCVTFLASEQASFVNGQCISVNGGRTFP